MGMVLRFVRSAMQGWMLFLVPVGLLSLAGPGVAAAGDPWLLWSTPTKLRGANIYQRRVYPALDGNEFMGPGPLGPPFTQEDFDRLAAFGANYVNISHSGLFTQKPPYQLDVEVRDNLDRLLEMARRAGLYAVISFRTGPGLRPTARRVRRRLLPQRE